MADLQPVDDFFGAILQIGDENERAAALVAGAFVENFLGWAIISRFRTNLSKTAQKKLFDNGALSEFSSKIEVGFALNLYNVEPRADLREILQIRNRFAHQLSVKDFDDEEVTRRCLNLKAPVFLKKVQKPKGMIPENAERTEAKQHFMDTIYHLSSGLSLLSKHPLAPPEAVVITY